MFELYDGIHKIKFETLNPSLDQTVESKFTDSQKILRAELYQFLVGDVKTDEDLDQIILRSCPKVQNGLDMYPQNTDLYRGTNFRGVSRNGRCNWQILTMVDGGKCYLGTVDNMIKAAVLYDIVSIQAKGLKAKTNFIYTRRELLAILFLKSLLEIKVTGQEVRNRTPQKEEFKRAFKSELDGVVQLEQQVIDPAEGSKPNTTEMVEAEVEAEDVPDEPEEEEQQEEPENSKTVEEISWKSFSVNSKHDNTNGRANRE